ncbi:MAG TPA: hypothetical protein DCE41_22180, partial [Cytophagales bacterium]|nr:hypothetical protein [Cytophagales bacterium]
LEPEPTESGSEGNLMEALQAEPQTFKLGALVPHVWAGMNIPYHLALPGGQPLGGVSDISNRGDLERLLISEYANDSEVFLSRLANGEALYLRREEPPASEEFQRIILVDISMKNWGTPKLIALSILVAIAHHPKSDITCTAFAVGNQLMPLDFTTVEGLMDAQQLLEGTLHAEVGLERFMQEHIPSKQTEVFFISTQAATEYPAMYRVLNEYHHQFTYWINVEHDGRVRLFKNRFNSKHLLQEFTLPLDRLWRNPPKEAKKHPSEIALTGSPGVHPYPLLFPVPNNALAIYRPNPKGPSYLSTRQKGVFKSGQGMGLGMELLAEASYIHKGCKFAILEQNEGLVWLTFVPQTRRGYLVNLSSGEETSFSLPNWRDSIKHAEFFSTEGAFYYLGFRYTYRIEPHDSPRVTKTEGVSPEMREAYENRLRTRFPSTAGSFSKVTNISISTTQTLVINGMPRLHTAVQSPGIQGGHVKQGKLLRLSTQGGMEWVSITRNHLRYVQGENRMDENHFKFGDGSIVEVDKRGILTCRSSDNDLPVFYLTMVMQNANAGATELVFTGPKDYKAPHTVQEPMDTRHFFETYVQAFCKRIIRWYEANA